MTMHELVDMLARLTVHMDEELRTLAHQSLQTLVVDFPDCRQDVIHGYTQFIVRDVLDTFPQLVENCTRLLLVFITIWRSALGTYSTGTLLKPTMTTATTAANATASTQPPHTITSLQTTSTINSNSSGASSLNSSGVSSITQTTAINATETSSSGKKAEQPLVTTMHYIEGFALVMLCNCRAYPRKLAVNIMKEVKNLSRALGLLETEPFLIDVIDKCCPIVLDRCLPILPQVDRMAMLNANVIDLQWIADRTGGHWITGHVEDSTKSSTSTLNLNQTASSTMSTTTVDPWAICLFGFMERENVLQQCPAVVSQAWPICFQRVTTLFSVIDPT